MRNVLSEYGYTDEFISEKINSVFNEIFENEETCFYHEQGDKAFMMDTGNTDARTEGMSYGMMMAVQMGRRDIFDKLWNWSMLHMYQKSGPFKGYFAWSCAPDGTKNYEGPAPDGEEYYAMALAFASHRFGDGEPPYDYSKQAKDILRTMIHSGRDGDKGKPMFNADNKLILFVPGCPFSDPSYHLPHYYELLADICYPEDKDFMLEAAEASRKYLRASCDPETGLAPNFADFNGAPFSHEGHMSHTHYSDSYRVALNIGLDALWFGKDIEWQKEEAERLQRFYLSHPYAMTDAVVTVDGKPYIGPVPKWAEIEPHDPTQQVPIMHPLGLLATAAAISAARPKNDESEQLIKRFIDSPLRKDKRRYYDNCLYFFSLLALSGKYEII